MHTEKALRDSEETYRTLVTQINDGFLVLERRGVINFANDALARILGIESADQLMGRSFVRFISPEMRAEMVERFNSIIRTGRHEEMVETRIVRADGSLGSIEFKPTPIIKGDRVVGVRGVLRDITQKKKTLEALKKSEETFRSVYEQAPIGICLFGEDGRFADMNKAGREILGVWTDKDLRLHNLFENPNLGEGERNALRDGRTVRREVAVDFEQVKRSGLFETWKSGTSYLHVIITPLDLKEGYRFGYLALLEDISAQRRDTEHIRTLSRKLLRAQEDERHRISRDLHDHVTQDLATLRIRFDLLSGKIHELPETIKQEIYGFSKMLQETIISLRRLVYDLRPPTLHELGFVGTIYRYCEEFSEKNAVSVDFYSAGIDEAALDSDTKINLYRLIQEALNNIRKHADAGRVLLRLVASHPDIILRIEDDGKGFQVDDAMGATAAEKGVGLQSMKERAALLGGSMQVRSQPNKGTSILVKVPYGRG